MNLDFQDWILRIVLPYGFKRKNFDVLRMQDNLEPVKIHDLQHPQHHSKLQTLNSELQTPDSELQTFT